MLSEEEEERFVTDCMQQLKYILSRDGGDSGKEIFERTQDQVGSMLARQIRFFDAQQQVRRQQHGQEKQR